MQRDLGLSLLGESIIGQTYAGIAKFSFGVGKLIRIYGPYAHPNILGGVIVLAMLMTLMLGKLIRPLFGPIVSLIFLSVILAFSRSAWLGVLLALVYFVIYRRVRFNKKLVISLLLIVLAFSTLLWARINDGENVAIAERLVGIEWASKLLINQGWWIGVGPGNYIQVLESYLTSSEISFEYWQLDYVHNVPLLVAVEWGLAPTMMLLIVVAMLMWRFRWLIALVPLIFMDHYFVTQYSPAIVLILILWVAIQFERADPEVADLSLP